MKPYIITSNTDFTVVLYATSKEDAERLGKFIWSMRAGGTAYIERIGIQAEELWEHIKDCNFLNVTRGDL